MMYISPELRRIGDARDVVLGVDQAGMDMDGTRVISDMENAPEHPFPSPFPQP